MTTDSLVNNDEGTLYLKGRQLGQSTTNQTPDSCKDCTVKCEDLWSIVQMQNIALESDSGHFIEDAMRRAKRTAGNYAQLFLSDEGTDKAGRFYWPGLAAFAAKEVVAGMDLALQFMSFDKAQSALGVARDSARITFYYLAKGNLWVFLEVTTWHLFYRSYGKELFEHCKARRNVQTYDPKAKAVITGLPWASGPNTGLINALREKVFVFGAAEIKDRAALQEMNYCQLTNHLADGFSALEQYEGMRSGNLKDGVAYSAAWSFLMHEQTLHLQKMVYEHQEFRDAIDMNDFGRLPVLRSLSGAKDPTVFFNASAEVTPEIEARELQPSGLHATDIKATMDEGKLYLTSDRMRYVKKILDKYHYLMTSKQGRYRPYMIGQISTIADWKDA
jgi:hypothetical protein